MGFRDFQDRRFAFRLNAHRIWARMPQISAWRGWYRTDGRTNSTGRFLKAVVWDSRRDCLSGLSDLYDFCGCGVLIALEILRQPFCVLWAGTLAMRRALCLLIKSLLFFRAWLLCRFCWLRWLRWLLFRFCRLRRLCRRIRGRSSRCWGNWTSRRIP